LAEEICYMNGPFAIQQSANLGAEGTVAGEESGSTAVTYTHALKRKGSDPNPERGMYNSCG